MTKSKSDIITDETATEEQLSAWARWQLPNMDIDVPVKDNALNLKHRRHHSAHPDRVEEREPEIKPPTADEIEAIRVAAFEEGRAEGREAGKAEGYKDGFSRGESDIKAAVTRLGQIARVLLEPIPSNDEELESAVLALVDSICKRVVQRELMLDASGLKKIVTTALDCLNPGSQRIRIHLNPVDCDMITSHLGSMGELENNWRVLPHTTITPGGCIIETDNSLIDVRAEKRLAAIVKQVFEQQQQALKEHSSEQGGMEQLLDEIAAFPAEDLSVVTDDEVADKDNPFNEP